IDRYRAPFKLTSDTLTLAWCGVTQGAARRERDQDGVQTEQTHGLCNDKGENHEHQRERATNRTQVLRECEGKGDARHDRSREDNSRLRRDPGGDGCYLRSEEHTSELQSRGHLVCRLLLEKKKKIT